MVVNTIYYLFLVYNTKYKHLFYSNNVHKVIIYTKSRISSLQVFDEILNKYIYLNYFQIKCKDNINCRRKYSFILKYNDYQYIRFKEEDKIKTILIKKCKFKL